MTRNTNMLMFRLVPALGLPGTAHAHASDQGFVLLLPTGAYTAAGVAAVTLTVVALFLIPDRVIRKVFSSRSLPNRDRDGFETFTSLCAFVLLAGLVVLGVVGPRDPLSNLMPLFFWAVGWMTLVSLSGLFGNFWRWLNPWTALYRLIGPDWRQRPLPDTLGQWPAVILLVGFAAFLLADIAPDDPFRLSVVVTVYWIVTMAGLLIAGPSWMAQVELGNSICGAFGRLAAFRRPAPAAIGGPGWQVIERPAPAGAGAFALTLLAAGSFDGLNETFWWFGLIGVNPLEFPGRSAVVWPTLVGLLAALLLLFSCFALTIRAGLWLGGQSLPFGQAFGRLALSLLPIALVYHVAHYLPSFLVTIQYTLAALSDPLNNGADLLGIAPFRVTTGFFNSLNTVRLIWLTQAGLVVLGHIWSVLLSHRIAMDLFPDGRRAALATLPLSLFMICYTFLGLWLLAAPRGA